MSSITSDSSSSSASGSPSALHFCQECNNILYPRASNREKKLMYACRNCSYEEPSSSNCVYVNEIKVSNLGNSLVISKEIVLDPALRRSKQIQCPQCNHMEAVFFGKSEEQMELIFKCTSSTCGHIWLQSQFNQK